MQANTQFLELYRANLRTATDVMKATLQSAERAQNQQLQALRGAMEETSRSAEQLAQVRSLDELMAFQTRFAGSQWERAVEYWTTLWRQASDSQMAVIGQVQSQMGQMQGQVRDMAREAAPQRQERKSA
ncbi:MAG TPA: phasin family protein [Burkholderiales bacterium]|nr:phasin family protein [Burkholderiales bacterium]